MTSRIERPIALLILDGWGIAPDSERNALSFAHTPFFDEIRTRFPYSLLEAAGSSVGLTDGSPGEPEAGHVNLGAGRVVNSDHSRIEAALATGEFSSNRVLVDAFSKAAAVGKAVHLVGLVSDGGVHSSSRTLYALLKIAKQCGATEVYVHCILDGRDVAPRTAEIYLEALEIKMNEIGIGKIATLCGRHFAMDADDNWDRTARAFTLMVHGEGERAEDASIAVRNSYLRGISDEFIAPVVIQSYDNAGGLIGEGDTVIFFNRRADTMRQLVRAVAVPDPGSRAAGSKPVVNSVCMVEYDAAFGLPVAFPRDHHRSSLSVVLAENQIPNWRFAESERLPHVTTFLNGGASPDSLQRIVTAPAVRDSAHFPEPEMGSFKLADKIVRTISDEPFGVMLANFSAADIAANSGDLEKTVEAAQYIDTCLGGIYEAVEARGGVLMVTSTHGNCEDVAVGADGLGPRPGTSNRVPFYLADLGGESGKLRREGSLQDVAPTVLGLLGLEIPEDMTGFDLRVR